jgi:hypothetical protein
MMDYHIVVPSDLTAGVNDQVKEMSLYNIGTFFGEVVKSEYILKTGRNILRQMLLPDYALLRGLLPSPHGFGRRK